MPMQALANQAPVVDLTTARLYREYHTAVLRWAARLTHSAADAEDVAQEVFLVVERRRADLAQVQNPASWLYRITTNIVRHRWRDQKRHGATALDSVGELPDETPSPLDDLERRREIEMFDRAFETLDEKQRDLLLMWDVRRLATSHISAITGVKAETLRVRRFRARLLITRRLREMEGDTGTNAPTNTNGMKIASKVLRARADETCNVDISGSRRDPVAPALGNRRVQKKAVAGSRAAARAVGATAGH
jgi:RNA polymerase sigma-70 factor (ECF subfamily)